MFANFVFAAHKKVQHGTMAGNWMMDGNKFHERWWFA
jgi:peptide/nickel transport system substrate-binding protein